MKKTVKTDAIILHYIRYKESSIIATVFTQQLGVISIIINSVRCQKPKYDIALFQPLTIVRTVVLYNPKNSLHRLSEICCAEPFHLIYQSVQKSSVLFFLNEVIYQCVKTESIEKPLFDFVKNSLLIFNRQTTGIGGFHIQFLLKMSHFLGFGIEKGNRITQELSHANVKKRQNNGKLIVHLDSFLDSGYGENISIHPHDKKEVLTNILAFYQLHIPNMGHLKSLKVLQSVFRHANKVS